MISFLVRRLLAGIVTLLVSTFAMYLLVAVTFERSRVYFRDIDSSTATNKQEQLQDRIDLLQLDVPVVQRYWNWLTSFIRGDFGTSWKSGESVNSMLEGAIVSTIQLVTASVIIAVFLGVAVGIVSALRQYSTFDYSTIFVAFVLYSLPSFWVAVLLKQWGAIGFNDFLKDPYIAYPVIILFGIISGVVISVAVGGRLPRRLRNGAIAGGLTIVALLYLQWSGWWNKPNIGPLILAVCGFSIAVGITTLVAGLKNRRAFGTAMSMAALGLVLYFPLQGMFRYQFTWAYVLGLGILTILVGLAAGYAWGGPDRGLSAWVGALTALPIASLIFVDQVLSVWPDYVSSSFIRGRPFPTIGDSTPNLGGNFWVQTLDSSMHLLLPTLSLILITFAGYTRYARGSMLEIMSQDYIRTARSKGLPERAVIVRHGFRNALIPLATIVPFDVVTLLGGAIITERIFARPGMGTMFIRSLDSGDIEPAMAYILIVGACAIVATILADILYAVLDPRIRVNA